MGTILPDTDPATWGLENLRGLINNITDLALLIAGGIAVIFIILGGISYLTAYGNEEKASAGKKTITWAIIGLIIILLAEVLVSFVWNFVTPTSFPANSISSGPSSPAAGRASPAISAGLPAFTQNPLNIASLNPNDIQGQIQTYLDGNLQNLTNQQIQNLGGQIISQLPSEAQETASQYLNTAQGQVQTYLQTQLQNVLQGPTQNSGDLYYNPSTEPEASVDYYDTYEDYQDHSIYDTGDLSTFANV